MIVFREATVIAEAVLPFLQDSSSMQSNIDIACAQAKALRMLTRRHEAIDIIQRTFREYDNNLSKDTKASLYLNLALAQQTDGNSDEAVEAARQVYQFVRPSSSTHLQVEALIAKETLSGQELTATWTRLERDARANNYVVTANNIALDLAKTANAADALRYLERVIKSSGDTYNHVRAVVAKAKSQLAKQGPVTVSAQDRESLVKAYSYLRGQRMASLFNTCHEALWLLLQSEGRLNAVLRLFRHSSFLWRIYGELTNEKKYVEELTKVNLNALGRSGGVASVDIVYFEGRRLEASEAAAG